MFNFQRNRDGAFNFGTPVFNAGIGSNNGLTNAMNQNNFSNILDNFGSVPGVTSNLGSGRFPGITESKLTTQNGIQGINLDNATDPGMLSQALGFLDNHGASLSMLGSLGQNIYGAVAGNKALKQQQSQLNWMKSMAEQNMANSRKSYNTRLEDREKSRAAYEGRDQASVDDYLAKNKL